MSDKLDWDVAVIGYDPTQRARYLDAIIDAWQSGKPAPEMDRGRRKIDLVRLIDDYDGRRSFYEALLKIQWLPSTIQRAVMKALGQSSHLLPPHQRKADRQQIGRKDWQFISAFSENASLGRSARFKHRREDGCLQSYRW